MNKSYALLICVGLVVALGMGLCTYYGVQCKHLHISEHALEVTWENLQLLDHNPEHLDQLRDATATLRQQLDGAYQRLCLAEKSFFQALKSENTIDFLFSLREQETALHQLGEQRHVKLPQDLGFSEYKKTPPASEQVPFLRKQLRLLSFLLSTLIESKQEDLQLFCIRHESDTALQPSEARGFILSPRITLRNKIPGLTTLGFKLTFACDTKTLQRYLNLLANDALPFIIRSVAVNAKAVYGSKQPGLQGSNIYTVALEYADAPASKNVFLVDAQ